MAGTPLDTLLQQIDADLNALFAPLRREVAAMLTQPKPDLAAFDRRVTASVGNLFGADRAAFPTSAIATYTTAALTAARSLGAGVVSPTTLEVLSFGESIAERLWRQGETLRSLIVANGHALALDPDLAPAERVRWTNQFLSIDGAENALGGEGSHALHEVRRTVSFETTREHGDGQKALATFGGRNLRWVLDPRHPVRDICDDLAGQDLHGLGRGVYPPEKVPRYPPHPHCLCRLEFVV